ncbi:GNAT family N-acetyltransferase [Flavobacterium granuli]|uniref:GNAT superfamily N-acetyltransferase n=1 Tax=Flavobacterium granuli TaxID=280093 RepID=A0ABU1S3I4_9FLAO|nr:GNAT family N-acetyltransferase [Flavobacterium granuli]MDR6845586.1 GNAT superfamily N-acetyltransferase [Flavobacterium granuli]
MENHSLAIKYSFNDILRDEPLGDNPNDFINKIEFEAYITDIYGKSSEVIAKGKISQILFGLAIDHGYPLFDVIDASESILDMCSVLFELEEGKDFWEKIEANFIDTIPVNYTICYLECLEIVPNYRGKGIGRMIIKSMTERFYDSCGLWVVKGFPIQHSGVIKKTAFEDLEQWDKQMDYNSFEKDFEKSQYKLFQYFQKLGFQNPVDIEYFIAQPFQIIDKKI